MKGKKVEVDLLPFILKLKIVDKELGVRPLSEVIHPAQIDIVKEVNRCINEGKPIRIIVLKARQIGMSTIIEAIQFALAFMLFRMRGMVIAHEMGSSEHLLSMTQNYYDTFFARDAYTQHNRSTKILSWRETKSQITISTAKNAQSARGKTIQFLHGSEVGFWDNAETLMTGLLQSVPSLPLTFIFLESTANGIGNYFNRTWNEACNGELDYIPKFYPWWTHPEYLGSKLSLPMIKGHLDEEERKLVKLFKSPPLERWNNFDCPPLSNEEIIDRLTWRRYAIKNLCKSDLDKFHQEYPATPDEAFISTGTNVFPLEPLDACFDEFTPRIGEVVREGDKVRFQPNIEGKLRIYKEPGRNSKYVVAGDPKRANEGDFCCAQVINRRTWELVATYRAKTDPVTFGEVMMNIGMYYNTALLVTELEGGGYGTIAVILDRNYPHVWQHQKAEKMPGQVDNSYGWHTNWKTKNEAVGNLKKCIVDGMTTFHDRTTYSEMKSYVATAKGSFGNGQDTDHDDTVMAYAIGITVCRYEMAEMLNDQPAEPSVFIPTGRGRRNHIEIEREAASHREESLGIEPDNLPPWMDWNVESMNDAL